MQTILFVAAILEVLAVVSVAGIGIFVALSLRKAVNAIAADLEEIEPDTDGWDDFSEGGNGKCD
ncbi:MAG: hypothetical protein IJ766_03860 [Clostridia bacterium]|nr:hypothetical protein [Clostridia bacterium]